MSDTLSSGVEIDLLSQEVEEHMFAASSPLIQSVAELDEYDPQTIQIEQEHRNETGAQEANRKNPPRIEECSAAESEGHASPELQKHVEGTRVVHGPLPSVPYVSELENPYPAASLRSHRQTRLERSYENEIDQQVEEIQNKMSESPDEVELEESIERRERINSTFEEATGIGDEAECKRGIIDDSESYQLPTDLRLLIAPVDGDNSDSFTAAAPITSASIRNARDDIQRTVQEIHQFDEQD